MPDDVSGAITRRRFMGIAGTAAAAGAGLGRLSGARAGAAAAASSRPVTAVVLVPGDERAAADSLVAGMRAGMGGGPSAHRRVTVRTFTGPRHAAEEAESALASRPDVLVAMVPAPVSTRMIAHVERAGVPLVAAGVGAHVVGPDQRHDLVYHHTLRYWQSSMAMGRWGVPAFGRRAFVVTSLRDAGYDTVYTFRRGVEEAGGRIAGIAVMHQPSDVPGALRSIGRARPDFVYALLSGTESREFVEAYASSSLARRVPLAGGGLSATSIAPAAASLSHGYTACTSWSGDEPFRELGAGLGRLLGAAARSGASLSLASARTAGLAFDPASNVVSGPLLVRRFEAGPNGAPTSRIVATADPVAALPDGLRSLQGPYRSGYTQEHRCA